MVLSFKPYIIMSKVLVLEVWGDVRISPSRGRLVTTGMPAGGASVFFGECIGLMLGNCHASCKVSGTLVWKRRAVASQRLRVEPADGSQNSGATLYLGPDIRIAVLGFSYFGPVFTEILNGEISA